MPSLRQGSLHLFRVAGIDVFLHWSWFVLAIIEIGSRKGIYSSMAWNALEYLALFAIVLMHEFGHALACRQVGGTANRIMLWPLGGVAYVSPPPRPGPMLWSLAAGPLVNAALIPILYVAVLMSGSLGWALSMPNAYQFLATVQFLNKWLLIFNILPIYPLDGGQILRSLLWYVLGRARSLVVATGLGIAGGVGFILLALRQRSEQGSEWLLLIAAYMLLNCWGGMKAARALIRSEKLPRREGFLCPGCGTAPAVGTHWKCPRCGQTFDTFETGAVCPLCKSQFSTTMCLECQQLRPMSEWIAGYYASRGAVSDASVAK
ncbi:Peptidase M50 [Candidatus Sulfotelmatomonas gaucii]|uniref:Peptidase M50 n=1 Tax=Candidatus Sulfuritelmatomonas gaucii TaxID=2043161 RepID=A0A2N9LVF8_9BACT|nr:Peptidase M50 [Candidatus Sulfotelmatomonas gaucii]